MKETTLEVGSNEKLSKLFGVFDENLNVLRAELGVEIRVKGTTLSIEGERAELCRTVLERLSALADAGETVDKTRLLYCVELAREGNDADIAKMMSGVVAITSRGKPVKCKTIGQKAYVDAIKNNTVVFGVGPAGTGKTYLAVALAVAAYKAKAVEKIILTRPAVEAGEKLGFLPGDLQQKVDPYLRPLYDALYEIMGAENFMKNMEKGLIEVAPLAYMRGRTLDNAFIVLDEAQNTTPEQMKMFLTRIGYGSKAVITGDVTQIDLTEGKRSGLMEATRILSGIEGIGQITLTNKDVVRHPLVQKIILAYEKFENRKRGEQDGKKERRIPHK